MMIIAYTRVVLGYLYPINDGTSYHSQLASRSYFLWGLAPWLSCYGCSDGVMLTLLQITRGRSPQYLFVSDKLDMDQEAACTPE